MKRFAFIAALAAGAFGTSGQLAAQVIAWPLKTVRIFVATPPGGGDDYVARLLTPRLGELLGQPFVAENRPGAGGLIAQNHVMQAAPDGYTWLLAGGSMAGARYISLAAKYDVLRDFTPVSLLESSPFVMLLHPGVPARTLRDYINMARTQPGKMTFATLGPGQMPYWAAHLFNSMAGVQALEVRYKAFGEVTADLVMGRVDYFFAPFPTAIALKDRLRLFAVTTAKRSPTLPEVPSLAESGLAGYDMPAYRGIMGPAGLPEELVRSLNAALVQALAISEVRDKLLSVGSVPQSSTPRQLEEKFVLLIARFSTLAKQAGLKPE